MGRLPRRVRLLVLFAALATALAVFGRPDEAIASRRAHVSTASASGAALSAPVPYVVKRAGRHFAGPKPPSPKSCGCYEPAQFQAYYDLPILYRFHLDGAGETIVIVECFGSPTIRADLATFDAAFHLPAPPKFSIITPAGRVTWRDNSAEQGWADETSLDVEYAHAIAPGANILLVETPVDETEGPAGFRQIVEAENYVISHHLGQVISQSFGATEETFGKHFARAIMPFRSALIAAQKAGVTVVSASGDNGVTSPSNVSATHYYLRRVNSWPSSDPLVTSVGGLQLYLNPNGVTKRPASVWNETGQFGTPSAGGGGDSAVFPAPAFQAPVASVVGNWRGTPDISMSASAFNNGALVYENYPGGSGWTPIGGTSEATPEFAGIVAIADQLAGRSLGDINPALYAMAADGDPGIVPITHGNNSVDFLQGAQDVSIPGYRADTTAAAATFGLRPVPYSMAAGLGTVDAALFVPELANEAASLSAHSTAPSHRHTYLIALLAASICLILLVVAMTLLVRSRRRSRPVVAETAA